MIEMEYIPMRSIDRIPKLLAHGQYKGYTYYILNNWSHPSAYVEIPRGHPWYWLEWNTSPIECHWGLSYSNNYLYGQNHGEWTIGWDYAHSGDFYCSILDPTNIMDDKEWTTREIFEEVKFVINQIKEVDPIERI